MFHFFKIMFILFVMVSSGIAQKPGIEVAISLERHKILVPVQIAGAPPLRMILDTGMGFDGLLIFDPQKRSLLEGMAVQQAQIGGAGDGSASQAWVAEQGRFFIGDLSFENQRIIILSGNGLADFPTDGVIGYSLFGHYAVEIDYARSVMRLHPPQGFSPDSSFTAIPLVFKQNRIPWIRGKMAVFADDSLSAAEFYIDSASGETVEVLLRDDRGPVLPPGLPARSLGRGLSGEITGHDGTIHLLALGRFSLTNLPAVFTPAVVRSRQPGADAILANGLLRRFHLVFDYTGSRLWLKPCSVLDGPKGSEKR